MGEVLVITIDRTFMACLTADDYRFLYSLPYCKSREVIGHYLSEAKGPELRVKFLNESGLTKVGTLPNDDDHVECLVAVGPYFYTVKQVLGDTREARRVERCSLQLSFSPESSLGGNPECARTDYSLDDRRTMHADNAFTESCADAGPVSPSFEHTPLLKATQSEPWHSRHEYVPCSPIVETEVGFSGSMFNTAKDLFLGQIEEDRHEESSSYCEDAAESVPEPEDKPDPFLKNSFGNLGRSSFGSLNVTNTPKFQQPKTPTTVEELFELGKAELEVRTLLEFLTKEGQADQAHQADQHLHPETIKRLRLFNPYEVIDLAMFKLLGECEPVVLIEEVYTPRGNEAEAVEAFFVEVVKFQPELCNVLLRRFEGSAPEELVAKMQQLQALLPSEALRKKFKRECYKYLSELSLRVVPSDLMLEPVEAADLELLLVFHPQARLVELSNPPDLLATILNIYFQLDVHEHANEELPVESVTIEDEQIEVTNPRNMLNIVMYFADKFGVEPAEAVRKYLLALLQKGDPELLGTVQRIVYVEGVLEICEMKPQVIEDIVKAYERYIYYDKPEAVSHFGACLELVRVDHDFRRRAQCRLSIIETLEPFNTLINFSDVYLIESMKSGCAFMQGLIRDEEPAVLCAIGLENIYENVWILEGPENENIKLSFYTRELLSLTELLIQKCVDSRCYPECLQCLDRVRPRAKVGLLLYCILRFLRNSFRSAASVDKYVTRFLHGTRDSLFELLTALVNEEPPADEAADTFEEGEISFLCSYEKMKERLDKCSGSILGEAALLPYETFCQLLYHRSKMVVVLSMFDRSVNEAALREFLGRMQQQGYFSKIPEKKHRPKDICPELPLVYSVPVLERWSPEPKLAKDDKENEQNGPDTIKRANSVEYLAVANSESLHHKTEDEDSQLGHSFRSSSMPYKKINSMRLRRRESSPESATLVELHRLEGEPQEARRYLAEQYRLKTFHQFVRLLAKAKSGLRLHYADELQQLEEYGLDFDFRRLFSLESLLCDEREDTFLAIREAVSRELTVRSFWIISYIVQYVLGEDYGRLVALLYIERQLELWQEEPNPEEARQRLRIVVDNFRLGRKDVEPLALEAERRGLRELLGVLRLPAYSC